jgi:hypothetical protein
MMMAEEMCFWCPRGVKTREEHRAQFLAHRKVPGIGWVCMFAEDAEKYDAALREEVRNTRSGLATR